MTADSRSLLPWVIGASATDRLLDMNEERATRQPTLLLMVDRHLKRHFAFTESHLKMSDI
jgi:hypothetical protein